MLKKFTAVLDIPYALSLGLKKIDDLFPIRYSPEYRDKMREEIRKIEAKNKKNLAEGKPLVQLDVEVDIHYAKRSISANNWLWMAHTLEARLINTKDQVWRDEHGITWYKPGAITPEEIHESYLERFAPRATVLVDNDNLEYFRQALTESTGRIVDETFIPAINKTQLTLWKTSSYMNVAEFCELSEHVKESLLSYGLDIESAADYKQLLTDLEEVKSRAVKQDSPPEENASTGTDNPPILKLRPDSVSIVQNVFSGTREE